jgi:uncharacterized protein YaaR (DUF327 family)
MDRINPLDSGHYSFKRSGRKKDKKRITLPKGRFFSLVEAMKNSEFMSDLNGEEEHGHTLAELLDEVHEAGDELKSGQNLQNIKHYKAAVKAFLTFVVDRMLAVEENLSGVNVLKRKRFTQIKVIDRKLERLTADILRNQAEQLEILSKIDEINGLLVNLLS